MSSKKGFTIIELAAVVILILVIMGLVAPNLIQISKDRKVDLYNSKISKIEANATTWGQRHLDLLSDKCTCIKVQTLIDGLFIAGEDTEKKYIYNPINNESMNNYNICVTYNYQTDRINAKLYKPDESQGQCR